MPSLGERELAENIRKRVARHAAGTDALQLAQLALLTLRSKVDGPDAKLAQLFGLSVQDVGTALAEGMRRLREDRTFHGLFHLIRSTV